MKADYVIGIDIGTQGTKTALYATDGTPAAEAFAASNLISDGPGIVEEDPEAQYGTVLSTIRACLEKSGVAPERVAAVAIDGQMAGIIGIGADGRAVTPYDSWLDTRCAPYIARMTEQAGNAVLSSTGNVPSFNHGPKILFWMNERKETWKKIVSFVQPGGYAAMRLCGLAGKDAYIDDTYLHFSGFADNAAGTWNEELCRQFNLDPGRLPSIRKPTDIIGRVTPEAAKLSGLAAGTPVAAGLGDTAASFLSCGAVEEGVCVDVSGTASVFATTTTRFRPDLGSRIMGIGHAAVPGLWHPYAYINGGGMDLLWYIDEIAPGAAVPAGGKQAVSYSQLNSLMEKLPLLADDPFFVPHMEGRVMPSNPDIRGSWAGLKRSHGHAHLYRSVLESIALEYAVYLKATLALYPELTMRQVRITGGGASNPLWNAMKADILGTPTVTIVGNGGAPMGAALVAAAASGAVSDLKKAAGSWVAVTAEVRPDVEKYAYYRARLGNYERLLDLLSHFPEIKETV